LQTTGAQAVLAFGADKLPVIAFHRDKRVFVAKCRDAACSKNTPSLVALARCCVDSPVVVAVGADGRPVLAYQDPNDFYVRVVKCGNASCSAGRTVSKLSSLVDRGGIRYLLNTISLDVPDDGRTALLIGDTTGAVRFVRCSDATCSKSTAVTVDRSGNKFLTATMALEGDGRPVIVEYASGQLKVASCNDPSCSSHTLTVVGKADDEFIASVAPQVALGPKGLPVVAYWVQGRVLRIAQCEDLACRASAISTFGKANTFAFALGADGLPIIAYYDGADLKVAHCSDLSCASR